MKIKEQLLLAGSITLLANAYLLPDTYWFRLFGLVNIGFLYGVLFVFAEFHQHKYAYFIAVTGFLFLMIVGITIEVN